MSLLLAILCFFGAAYLVYIAAIDKYAPDHVRAVLGDLAGNSTSLIWVRFLIAALLTFAGVKLL